MSEAIRLEHWDEYERREREMLEKWAARSR